MKTIQLAEKTDLERFFASNPGITKKEFAQRANVTKEMIYKIINDDINISIAMSERIIRVFAFYNFSS